MVPTSPRTLFSAGRSRPFVPGAHVAPDPDPAPSRAPVDGFVSAAEYAKTQAEGPSASESADDGAAGKTKKRAPKRSGKKTDTREKPLLKPFPRGLEPRVVAAVKKTGIEKLYPPQREAMDAVLSGHNVLVAVPTASGKSLVAHQTILHTLLTRGGKALYIVPLRALATEKYEELRELVANVPDARLRVALATGDLDEADTRLGDYDIVVTTSEKADSLIRHGVGWFQELSVVVADEVHLIGDGGRGPTLEVTLARLLGLTREVRLVALSATVGNAQEVADWLGARLIESDWRPVPLREGVFEGDAITFADGGVKEVEPGADAVVRLVVDAARDGGQALVFVSTRRSTEATAKKVATHLRKDLPAESKRVLEAAADGLETQDGESSRLGGRLAQAIRGGAAFHNAGLSSAQRRTVEGLFKGGHLGAIVATPTLAAGVNLPARRVVVRDLKRYSPERGSAPLPVLEVKQMTGRAGRPRYDPYGEAVLVARSPADQKEYVEVYLHGVPEPVESALAQESALRIHLLAGVAAGLTPTKESVLEFMGATFLARDPFAGAPHVLRPRVEQVLEFLVDEGFIEEHADGALTPTRFGRRVSSLYVDPMSAILIREGLAMTRLVPQVEDLALLVLVASTPDVPPLWLRRGDDWVEALAEENEGRWLRPVPQDPGEQERFLGELKTALLFKDWIEEARLDVLEDRYGMGPGDINNRINIAAWLLYAAEEIARLEGHEAAAQLNRLKRRVQAGVREDLLPLLALQGIGRYRARVLAKAGWRSVDRLRKAHVARLLSLSGFGPRLVAQLLSQLGRPESLEDVQRVQRGRGSGKTEIDEGSTTGERDEGKAEDGGKDKEKSTGATRKKRRQRPSGAKPSTEATDKAGETVKRDQTRLSSFGEEDS